MAAALALAAGGCKKSAPAETLITYYNAEHALSVRYPSSWTTDQARQGDVWYRYFQSPPAGEDRKPEVTVTLVTSVTGAGLKESHVHDVIITKEAPNYRLE